MLDLDSPVGKVLRIDPETGAGDDRNPHFDAAAPTSNRSRVLARGLRNPYRLSVDAATGDIWVGDVGNGAWEEINLIPPTWSDADRELNFGWPCYEGGSGRSALQVAYSVRPRVRGRCAAMYTRAEGGTGAGAAAPVHGWAHSGKGDSVVVGPVHHGAAYSGAYAGHLFFANFSRDRFFTRAPDGRVRPFGTPGGFGMATDIQTGPAGTIVYADLASGTLREIVGAPATSRRNVRVSVTARIARAGSRRVLHVSGTTRPAQHGRVVVIERLVGRRSVRLCAVRTGGAGSFSGRCALPARARGTVRVRACLPRTGRTRAAATRYVVAARAPRR